MGQNTTALGGLLFAVIASARGIDFPRHDRITLVTVITDGVPALSNTVDPIPPLLFRGVLDLDPGH
jgi:hypothetical protein